MGIARVCFREPIPEIAHAANYLDEAVTAHLSGNSDQARQLIKKADMPVLREYTESIWGKSSPYVQTKVIAGAPAVEKIKARMRGSEIIRQLHARDKFHCRFCGIPVIRKETRQRIQKIYADVIGWSQKNVECHSAFQVMWAQYDHILPHSRGGITIWRIYWSHVPPVISAE